MKNSNDAIGNRTRDLPACSAVPQPTAPPRAPVVWGSYINITAKINYSHFVTTILSVWLQFQMRMKQFIVDEILVKLPKYTYEFIFQSIPVLALECGRHITAKSLFHHVDMNQPLKHKCLNGEKKNDDTSVPHYPSDSVLYHCSSCHIIMDAIPQPVTENCCVPQQTLRSLFQPSTITHMKQKTKMPLCGPLISLSFIIFVIIDLRLTHVEFLFVKRIPSGNVRTEFNGLLGQAQLPVCVVFQSKTLTEGYDGSFPHNDRSSFRFVDFSPVNSLRFPDRCSVCPRSLQTSVPTAAMYILHPNWTGRALCI